MVESMVEGSNWTAPGWEKGREMRRSRGSTCHSMPIANLCNIISVDLIPRISAALKNLCKRHLSGTIIVRGI